MKFYNSNGIRVVPLHNGSEGNCQINQCFSNGLNVIGAKGITPKGVAIVGLQRLHFRMRWGVKTDYNEDYKKSNIDRFAE